MFGDDSAKQEKKYLQVYVGRRAHYYIPRWERMRAAERVPSWNWSAFAFSSLWALYRKMWLVGVAILLAQFLVPQILPGVGWLINGAINVGFAILANHLYMQQAETQVARARALGGDDGEVRAQLIPRGGTTFVPVIVVVALWGVILVTSLPGVL